MKLSKKILKSNFVGWLLANIAYLYIRFVYKTTKWQIIGQENIDELAHLKSGSFIAFWHGRLLMIPNFAIKNKKFHVLSSRHRDGSLMKQVTSKFGFTTIWGSTGKGGARAVKDAMQILQSDHKNVLSITPDGPRGPKHIVAGNIVDIASKTKSPIFPLTYSTSNAKFLKSWDRFLLPKPFGKGCFICDKPIYFTGDESKEDKDIIKKQLQDQLNAITKKADKIVGV